MTIDDAAHETIILALADKSVLHPHELVSVGLALGVALETKEVDFAEDFDT